MKYYLKQCAGIAALAGLGLGGMAQAQEVEDVTAVIDNIEPTAVALTEGVADTLTTAIETQSLVETDAALEDALVETIVAAVDGAPTLGDIGTAASAGWLTEGTQTYRPVLAMIDAPSEGSMEALFNPDDVSTIARNVEVVAENLLDGSIPGFTTGVRQGIYAPNDLGFGPIGILQGNFQLGISGTVFAINSGFRDLIRDSNLDAEMGLGGTLQRTVIGIPLVFIEPHLADASEETIPVFEEYVVPYVEQPVLGFSLADTLYTVELEETLDFIGYSDMLDMLNQ